MCKNILYFSWYMETGELAQATIALLEWSWNIEDVIGNPFSSSESFFNVILQNQFWFRFAVVIFFLWLTALIRVIKDSNARSSSFRFQMLSALLVIFLTPIFWILLYIAIRPQWWKWDKSPWRDVAFQQIQACENCWSFNNIENAYCINCWECLQNTCRECSKKYSKSYAYCPNCWAPRMEE